MKFHLAIAALLYAAACGGDDSRSGVDGGKQLSALTRAERTELCQWALEIDTDTVGSECGPENPPTVADCVEDLEEYPASCGVTVAELQGCIEALAEDPCGEDPEECNFGGGDCD